jgi:hypothetical protein
MFAFKISFEIPEWAESSAVAARWHNATVKELLREQLTIHRDQRIDRHFVHSAHSRYGYAKRTEKYQRWKNRNRGRDIKVTTFSGSKRTGDYQTSYGVDRLAPDANLSLVKTGRTRREIKSGAAITIGGTGNNIRGRLTLKVPIPGSSGREMDFAARLRLSASGKGRRKLATMHAQSRLDTVKRTVTEIEAFAADEVREINAFMATGYAQKLNTRRLRRKK